MTNHYLYEAGLVSKYSLVCLSRYGLENTCKFTYFDIKLSTTSTHLLSFDCTWLIEVRF